MTMTADQLKHFEARLREERAEAQALLTRFVDDSRREDEQDRSGDLSKVPIHPADLGTDTIDEEMDVANAERLSRRLAEIDAALERIETAPDRYGRCDDTGVQIPLERLELVPWARTCAQAGA